MDSGLVPPFDVSSLTVYRIASSKHEGSGFAQEAVLTGPTSGPEERQARDQPAVHSSSRSRRAPGSQELSIDHSQENFWILQKPR